LLLLLLQLLLVLLLQLLCHTHLFLLDLSEPVKFNLKLHVPSTNLILHPQLLLLL
jgi:hypothetical protein